jgi:NAD(P)-dependent dehydrogenase (short-subunit alcohol dehydrogenase family)
MGCEYSSPVQKAHVHWDAFKGSFPSMQGRSFAITGCSTGTGRVAAKLCAEKGAKRVLMLNRASDRAEAAVKEVQAAAAADPATGTKCEVIHVDCDLTNLEEVRKAAEAVKRACPEGLDCLCNNAGVMLFNDVVTQDGLDIQMQTNHHSHYLLTALLLDSLAKAAGAKGDARIVQHSSVAKEGDKIEEKYFKAHAAGELGGDGAGPNNERYHHSKLANVVFAYALDAELKKRGGNYAKIKSLVAHPGSSATNLAVTTSAANNSTIINMLMSFFANVVSQSPEDGAMGILTCMACEHGSSGRSAKAEDMTIPVESGGLWGPTGMGMTGLAEKLPEQTNATWDCQTNILEWTEDSTGAGLIDQATIAKRRACADKEEYLKAP